MLPLTCSSLGIIPWLIKLGMGGFDRLKIGWSVLILQPWFIPGGSWSPLDELIRSERTQRTKDLGELGSKGSRVISHTAFWMCPWNQNCVVSVHICKLKLDVLRLRSPRFCLGSLIIVSRTVECRELRSIGRNVGLFLRVINDNLEGFSLLWGIALFAFNWLWV